MRTANLLFVAISLSPSLASAQAIIGAPGYAVPGFPPSSTTVPYPATAIPFAPGYPIYRPIAPYVGNSVAGGTYPPGAQTCVAADEICRATAPNTVGNSCSCPGRDGRPIPGIVR